MPTWCSIRRGSSWSSSSIASKPAASASVMVRWMWTGSPQPPPASSTIGSLQTARMSTATSASSGNVRFASVTHFTQPSDPPDRYTALKPASSAIRAISGLSASGATTSSLPAISCLSFCKSRSPATTWIATSMGKQVAKLKVMCARSMHDVVDALAEAFTQQTGHEIDLHYGTVGALQKRLDGGETADVLILGTAAVDKLAQAGVIDPATKTPVATTSVSIAVRAGGTPPDMSTPEAFRAALVNAKAIALSDPAVGG